MTLAVCVRCGGLKHGDFNPCDGCGFEPETEIDAAYSLALTEHDFAVAVLEEISASIRSGRPRPSPCPRIRRNGSERRAVPS